MFTKEEKIEEDKISSWLFYLGRFVLDQSSPVHLVSESRGGSLSVTDKRQRRRTEKIVSNVGY